jgi:hypothetical protein
MSPHLRSHYHQNQSPPQQRTSQHSTCGTWNTTKYHDENYYTYAFLAQVHEPSFVSEALSVLTPHNGKLLWTKNINP